LNKKEKDCMAKKTVFRGVAGLPVGKKKKLGKSESRYVAGGAEKKGKKS